MDNRSKYTSGRYRVTQPKPERRTRDAFGAALKAWRKHLDETLNLSFPSVAIKCDAFRSMIGLGEAILPLVFENYVDVETPWGAVLAAIKPGVVMGDGLTGDLWETRENWLKWAESAGMIALIS